MGWKVTVMFWNVNAIPPAQDGGHAEEERLQRRDVANEAGGAPHERSAGGFARTRLSAATPHLR